METREQVIEFIRKVKVGYLATVGQDNIPRVRPVVITTVYGDDLYFFTFANTRKVKEIEHQPQVEVAWAEMGTNGQVRISGRLSVEKDESIVERFKSDNPIIAQMLPPGAEKLFLLYKLTPTNVYAVSGLKPYNQVSW